MPSATVSLLYPKTETSTFNRDYYIATHMTLVTKIWSNLGLKSWNVTEFGDDSPYSYGAFLVWESLEAFTKATQDPAGKEVMDDVKNFSSEKPLLVAGEMVASS